MAVENEVQDSYEARPIGWVRSPLTTLKDAPQQGHEGGPEAVVEIRTAFVEGLEGIGEGSDLILLTWLHLAARGVMMADPRDDDAELPRSGVFATRSADRPNPIGLHRVLVVAVEPGGRLRVAPLEAIDGTPVLDIKPVLSPDSGLDEDG